MTRLLYFCLQSIFLIMSTGFYAHAQTSLVYGNCNVVNQSVAISDGSVLNQSIDCVPRSVENSFRLRYVWLDEMSFSLLISRTPSEPMDALLGKHPLIVKNEIYAELKEIWLRFAQPASSFKHSGLTTQVLGQSGTRSLSDLLLTRLDEESLERIRLLHSQPIVWPYGLRSEEISRTRGFPVELNMTYGTDYLDYIENEINSMRGSDDHSSVSSSAISCVILYDFVSQLQFANYWKDVRVVGEMIDEEPALSKYVIPTYSPTGAPAWVDNGGYASVAYLSRLNWPEDFLLRIGRPLLDDCAGVKEFSFSALPRKLFVKLAVIEFQNSQYDLRSINYNIDRDYSIRDAPSYVEAMEMGLGSLSPGAGRSVLVPLSIELRYALDEPPFRFIQPNPDSKRFAEAIQGSPFNAFDVDGWFKKDKDSFRIPQHKRIKGTYIYGPAIELTSLNVGGERIDARKAPAVAAVTDGYFEEGSCPFLYFVGLDGTILRYGRILIGTNGHQNRRKETIKIPPGTRFVLIQEEEPEISYLDEIVLHKHAAGEDVEVERYTNIKLLPQHAIKIPIPFSTESALLIGGETDLEKYWISVEGFYKTAP